MDIDLGWLDKLGRIVDWYFDSLPKSYVVSLLRRFILYYVIVFIISVISLCVILPYRLWMTYVMRKDVSEAMGGIAYALYHLVMPPKYLSWREHKEWQLSNVKYTN
jgi:hypothetical protein